MMVNARAWLVAVARNVLTAVLMVVTVTNVDRQDYFLVALGPIPE